jgi:hypothetical protein
MDSKQEKLKMAQAERDRYLEKLRSQSRRRDTMKDLRDQAIEKRAQAEAVTSQQFRDNILRRHEFRAQVKLTWLEGHKTHEEMMRKLGEIYKERLSLNFGRFLESAKVRTAVNRRTPNVDGTRQAPSQERPLPHLLPPPNHETPPAQQPNKIVTHE